MPNPVKTARKKKGSTAKQEAERERLETLIDANEERLASGLAANGAPLSDKQKDTLREVIRLQREKLEQINESL